VSLVVPFFGRVFIEMEITWKCAGPPKSPQTIFYMISCYFIVFYRWSEYAEEKSIQRSAKVDEGGHNCHLTFFFWLPYTQQITRTQVSCFYKDGTLPIRWIGWIRLTWWKLEADWTGKGAPRPESTGGQQGPFSFSLSVQTSLSLVGSLIWFPRAQSCRRDHLPRSSSSSPDRNITIPGWCGL
jgi:hypothetical protein